MNSHPQVYRIFDVCVSSELPLPGLAVCADGRPEWRVTLVRGKPDEAGYQRFHSWDAPDGQQLMASARKGEDYLLQIGGLGWFRIAFDQRRIEVYRGQGCADSTLAHLLLDQVIPRTLCHQGRMVMHASAVVLKNGTAVAFTAPSGRGKSTLASAFFQDGHRLVTDDCLLLECRDNRVWAIPAYPSLRLWQDSAAALFAQGEPADTKFSEMAHYTNKKQLLFEQPEMAAAADWIELSALFLLEEPPAPGAEGAVRATPAGGMSSIVALIESLFALDVVRKEIVQRNFAMVGRVARGVPVFRLSYPRRYEFLPDVMKAVTRLSE